MASRVLVCHSMAAQRNKVHPKRAEAPRIDAQSRGASNRNKARTPFAWERAIPFFHFITSQKIFVVGPAKEGA